MLVCARARALVCVWVGGGCVVIVCGPVSRLCVGLRGDCGGDCGDDCTCHWPRARGKYSFSYSVSKLVRAEIHNAAPLRGSSGTGGVNTL